MWIILIILVSITVGITIMHSCWLGAQTSRQMTEYLIKEAIHEHSHR
jgi:hypothetical protein